MAKLSAITQSDLTGNVAVVTGGGSGLGRQFCEALAEAGADVVCPDLHKDWADETCSIISRYGHRTLPLETDVTKYEQVQLALRQVMDNFGKLDILVNNAGVSLPPSLIDQVDLTDWHEVIDVNLHGVFYCLKEGLKIMKRQRSGVIVNISSIFGLGVSRASALSPYVASKFAVVGLTREAASEYGQYGIRVNCIAPGFFLGTRLGLEGPGASTPRPTAPDSSILAARTPLNRTGDPKELKSLLLYLVSDSSAFMTGQVVALDGGWSIW
jgi:NAD(P)-dependent dehydrogenase (short-subunit alcohol dehydrogenase family)